MPRLTSKQVRERLTAMLGSNLLVEGVDPSTAMGGILEIIESVESFETEQATHNTAIETLQSANTDLTSKLSFAQETNLKLLKRVDIGDTIDLGNDNSKNDEPAGIEKLLSDNNKEE